MITIGQKQLQFRGWVARKIPFIWQYVRLFRWRFGQPVYRKLIRLKTKQSGLHVDPYNIYWISPRRMKHAIYSQIDGVSNTAFASGVIKNGNWDKQTVLVEDLCIIQSAKERFIEGKNWEDTKYYCIHLEKITKGQEWRGCTSKEDLNEYFRNFDQLFKGIKNNGYKTQNQILDSQFAGTVAVENEIAVHIDRDGRFIFCNGAHRLCIALVLGIEKIPVKVCIRHANWQVFCQEILTYAQNNGGKVYQPILHPDLHNISSAHSEDRFKIISDHIPQNKGTLLDVGANWGYFSHCFEELGFDCYAVENDLRTMYFLDKLKLAEDRKFSIVGESILTYTKKNKFNVVLALNIFHHFLKIKTDYDALISFLERTDIETMFFEPHLTDEAQMKNAYRNYEPDEFVQFILKYTGFNNSEIIGKAEDERPIYKLWK